MIKDLLPLTTVQHFNGVNARNLHQALKIGRDFSNWIKSRLSGADFIEEQDFIVQKTAIGSPKLASQKGGNKREVDEYILSIDTAKHICLMEKNEVGREIRNYFIQAEKQLRKVAPNVYRNNVEAIQKRLASIDHNHALKQALQSHLLRQGKQPQAKYFINESKMIDGLTVGGNIHRWKAERGITGNPRDYFTLAQLDVVQALEKANCALLELDMPYPARKAQLTVLSMRLNRGALS